MIRVGEFDQSGNRPEAHRARPSPNGAPLQHSHNSDLCDQPVDELTFVPAQEMAVLNHGVMKQRVFRPLGRDMGREQLSGDHLPEGGDVVGATNPPTPEHHPMGEFD
jgi:hypothetical protein